MNFIEKLGAFINEDGEKRMIEKEHQKIRRLVEQTDAEGLSLCHYSHDDSDGWAWGRKDYLELRLWLNSLGLFSLKDEDGIYIMWAQDENMRSLIRQQNQTLKAVYRKEYGSYEL